MKLKYSLRSTRSADPSACDILVAADVTVTVGQIAARILGQGIAPRDATLRVQYPGASEYVVLDGFAALPDAHLRPGSNIEAINTDQVVPGGLKAFTVCAVCVDSRGHQWSLVNGHNVVGRDKSARIFLASRTVSRKHAVIEVIDGKATINDLGAANGVLINGTPISSAVIQQGDCLTIGDQELTFQWAMTPRQHAVPDTVTAYVRSPRVESYAQTKHENLPTPPDAPTPQHMPLIAIIAPLIMGVASYAMTRSPYSLILIGMAPLMMLGGWLDGLLGGKKDYKQQLAAYHLGLDRLDQDIAQQQAKEREIRNAEFPLPSALAESIVHHNDLLWTRRPEHSTFLECRVGLGKDRSRIQLDLPPRGNIEDELWMKLSGIRDAHIYVEPVPLLVSLRESGGLGIVGNRFARDDLMRSVVLQLAALHAPSELVLAGLAETGASNTWSWLKWLPHVSPPHSPIAGAQLAEGSTENHRLLTRIEELVALRQQRHAESTLRSHLSTDHRVGEAHGVPVAELPMLPVVVALINGDPGVDSGRLVQLAEAGPDVGVFTLWLQRARSALPAACRTYVEIADDFGAALGYVRESVILDVRQLDRIDAIAAERLARELAGIEDAGMQAMDDSDLPSKVSLHELMPFDVVGAPYGVIASWRASGSIKREWRTGVERRPGTLPAIVGQGIAGPLSLDLREQGPHALVGGTTGSGKSEFLQTWIMSMAATLSPDRLTFLLVDYKGGAAFAECVDLPHTVGLVTDLSPHLVQRALTSLRAELTYREHLLNEHNAKDLVMMERNANKLAPPNLVIVIDEFAALAADVPEFVDGVVDVAARGRSLGVHLIMATQRPKGVINDNLRANTNLRVALRMADPTDSSDVIDTDIAAHFDPSTPGRGAVRVGPGRISGFQTAYIGAPVRTAQAQPDLTITDLPFGFGAQWPAPALAERADHGPREIEVMLQHIQSASQTLTLAAPRRPWLDELPVVIALESLGGEDDTSSVVWPLGLQDEPALQRQATWAMAPEVDGHIMFVGSAGSGKSSALRTVAASATARATRDAPVWVYGIAAGSGLSVLTELPIVGDVLSIEDRERVPRLLRWLVALAKERSTRNALAKVATHSEWLRSQAPVTHDTENVDAHEITQSTRIVLLIDGFGTLLETFGSDRQFDIERTIDDVLAFGANVGIHVAVTVDRQRVIPPRFHGYFGKTLILNVSDDEASAAGVPAGFFNEASAGRGYSSGLEVQIALPNGATTAGGDAEAMVVEAERWRQRILGPQSSEHMSLPDDVIAQWCAPAIRLLPERIQLGQLAPTDIEGNPAIAMADDDFSSVGYSTRGIAAVYGHSKSGTSTALRTAVAAYVRQCKTERINAEVLWLTNEDESSAAPPSVSAAVGEYAVLEALQKLLASPQYAGTVAGPDPSRSSLDTFAAQPSVSNAVDFSIPSAATVTKDNALDLAGNELSVESDASEPATGRRAKQPTPAELEAREAAVTAALESMWDLDTQEVTQTDVSDWSIPSAVTGPSKGANAAFADAQSIPLIDSAGSIEHNGAVPGMIVIERLTDFIGGPAERGIEALLRCTARQRWNVVVEADIALISSSWDLQNALRAARTTLVLRPEESDGYTVARVELPAEDMSEFPPGRGYLIAGGRVRKVQVALP